MAQTLTLHPRTAEDTRDIGEAVGRLIGMGGYICLYGELGSGKTTFVQGLARGLDVRDPYITSPSFALVNEYRGRLELYHIDLYRLQGPLDLEGIGFTEYPKEGVAAVEWPERAGPLLPDCRLEVRMEYEGEAGRTMDLTALGKDYEDLLEELCRMSRWSGR